jgi:hypothetical protein
LSPYVNHWINQLTVFPQKKSQLHPVANFDTQYFLVDAHLGNKNWHIYISISHWCERGLLIAAKDIAIILREQGIDVIVIQKKRSTAYSFQG